VTDRRHVLVVDAQALIRVPAIDAIDSLIAFHDHPPGLD
jgi:hypothetical protein